MSWRMLDLFTGLAGFTLAAHEVWDDVETVSFVEIDKRCREFLSRAWPGVPIHDDIKTLDATKWRGSIDLLTGGVPCQPASRAGKQRGEEDDRWLWDQALRVCEECLPTWCLFENPPGIGDVGLDGILSALEGIGYEVQTVDIPACAVNAPHLRHRYWIICHFENSSESRSRNRGDLAYTMPYGKSKNIRGSNESVNSWKSGRSTNDPFCECSEHRDLADMRCQGCEGSVAEPGTHGLHTEHPQGDLADTMFTGSCNTKNQTKAESNRLRKNRRIHQRGYRFQGKLLPNWSSYTWLPCADGKVRRAPDDSLRMAHGLPVELSEILGEEGRQTIEDCEPHRSFLGALGNSIVPRVAVEIMKAIKKAHEGRWCYWPDRYTGQEPCSHQ